MGKTVAMAPALTEPISHRQSKISSPTQASSPHPIISDVSEQSQTSTVAAAPNPHRRLASQTNGGGVTIDDATKELQNIQIDNQLDEQLLEQSPKKTNNQFKVEHFITPDFQSTFTQQIQSTNG